MMRESQMRYVEISCPKKNSTEKFEVTKESNEIVAAKNREDAVPSKEKKKSSFTFTGQEVVWSNAIITFIFHVLALYCFITFPYTERLKTFLFCWFCGFLASLGVTVGVHRLWTHRSYKAKTPLRILLMCFYCIAGQYSIYTWVRDHRAHHKFSETDADPHNSQRGFFFSHVGWLMLRRHPDVIKKGRQIDMSDVLADPVVAFNEKYFQLLRIFFCFILPIIIPVYFWNEDWYYAIASQWFIRHVVLLNGTWSVNSLAHMYGKRPYDKTIAPSENPLVSFITVGEGWHNYHHTFPWDYKADEFNNRILNVSTHFIHLLAAIGWAYDLKEPSPDLVRKVIARKGDGSHHSEIPLPPEEIKATM